MSWVLCKKSPRPDLENDFLLGDHWHLGMCPASATSFAPSERLTIWINRNALAANDNRDR
jgi:hypothetical protein